jgi:predicted permease
MEWPWRRRARREAELAEEIRAHMRMAVEDRIARGESPAEAVRAARREFGSDVEVREVTRAMWGGQWWERLRQDVRYALRSLRRTPSFTFAAVLTLALGIGANTAVFTVVNGVLLRPLPFPDPDRLVLVAHGPPPGPFLPTPGVADRDFLALERYDAGFAHVATFSNQPVALTGAGEPARLNAAVATTSFFRVLAVAPALGRGFAAGEDVEGRDDVVVLGDALWRSRFAGNPRVLGAAVTIDGVRRIVIGVMPPGFDFPNRAELWLPFGVRLDPRNGRSRPVVARLRDDVALEQSRAAFATFVAGLPRGDDADEIDSGIEPLSAYVAGRVRPVLVLLMGAVAFVLLIACANVSNLLLMRGAGRSRELTVRAALGAGRARLVRQLLTECVAIALLGGTAGVLLAYVGVAVLPALAPPGLPRPEAIRVDAMVLGATAGASLVAALVFGLLPSLHATRRDLRAGLTVAGRAPNRDRGRLRGALVLGQIALALVLLTGAGLMLRSFRNMRAVELGFTPRNVLTVTVDLPASDYADVAAMRAVHDRVLARLAATAAIEAAGAVNWRPFGDMIVAGDFSVENGPVLPSGYWADKLAVSPDYFRALGIRVQRGRAFTAADRIGAQKVVIVSRALADRFWPDGDAIGKRIAVTREPGPDDWLTIVGVVDAILQRAITDPPAAAIYWPIAQLEGAFFLSRMTYLARGAGAPHDIAALMRAAVRAADPNLPVHTVASMDALVASMTDEPRFQALLLTTFSLIALGLAAVGVYGVLAYGVAQRRFEIGLRIALGARTADVVGGVLRSSLGLAAAGVALGTFGAAIVTRTLQTYLFQVSATDPLTFAAAAAVLGLTAVLAACVPARRAAGVQPAGVLKGE